MAKFHLHLVLTFVLGLVVLSKIGFTSAATLIEKDENPKGLCADKCFCDGGIKPYLIDCKERDLVELYNPEEWDLTLKNRNISDDVDLDVRFNDNRLKRIPAFKPLRIVNLSFRHNFINVIEDHAFSELEFLLSLDLSQNNFTAQDLPEKVFLGKLSNDSYRPLPMQHLNLSHNHIHSIEKDLFEHLTALTSLDLSYNPLRILGGSTSMSIARLRKLQYLNLAHSQISTIPAGMIHDLMFLISLDLTGNKFKVVPPEIQNSHNLEVLVLDDNDFESFDFESFIGLSKLKSLSISFMSELKIIEERTFSPLKCLMTLMCQHNPKLDKISNAAFFEIYMKDGNKQDWPVKEIAFNDNAFKHIDRELAQWDKVNVINIQNNPFNCDCNLRWLVESLVPPLEREHPDLTRDLVCSSPDVMKGNTLLDLSTIPSTFSKCDQDSDEFLDDLAIPHVNDYHTAGVTVLTIGIILIIIGLAVLGVIIVKRRAIASAFVAHQEIRYKRADADDTESYRNPNSQMFRST